MKFHIKMSSDKYFCIYPVSKNINVEIHYIQNLIEIYTTSPIMGWWALDHPRLKTDFWTDDGLYCLKSLLQPILEVHFPQNLINKAFAKDLVPTENEKTGFCNVTFKDKRTRFMISDLQKLKSKFLLEQEYSNVYLDMKCQDLQHIARYILGKIPATKKIFQDLEYLDSDLSLKAARELVREFFSNITYFSDGE